MSERDKQTKEMYFIFYQMSERDKQTIELHEISANVMGVLLDFVYTETVNVSVENVQELLPAACLLQLTGKLDFVDTL